MLHAVLAGGVLCFFLLSSDIKPTRSGPSKSFFVLSPKGVHRIAIATRLQTIAMPGLIGWRFDCIVAVGRKIGTRQLLALTSMTTAFCTQARCVDWGGLSCFVFFYRKGKSRAIARRYVLKTGEKGW